VHCAAYCSVPVPAAIEAVAGVTVIPVNVAPVTVKLALPETLPVVALMVVVPAAAPVARPPFEIVAVAVLLLDQVTLLVQLDVELSE